MYPRPQFQLSQQIIRYIIIIYYINITIINVFSPKITFF